MSLSKKNKLLIIGVVVGFVVVFLAITPMFDDGDQASRLVLEKYGEDIFQKTQTNNCATDGVGIKRVPFGYVLQHCNTHWFVAGVGGVIFQY